MKKKTKQTKPAKPNSEDEHDSKDPSLDFIGMPAQETITKGNDDEEEKKKKQLSSVSVLGKRKATHMPIKEDNKQTKVIQRQQSSNSEQPKQALKLTDTNSYQ